MPDVRDIIRERTKRLEVCDKLQDVMYAPDDQAVLDAAIPLIEWAYRADMIDTDLAGAIDEGTLNTNFIFINAFTPITDAWMDIYLLRSAEGTINITANHKQKIYILGASGNITIALNDYSYAEIKIVDCPHDILILLDGTSTAIVENTNSPSVTVVTKSNCVAHVKGYKDSHYALDAQGTSYINGSLFYNAVADGTIEDTGEIEVRTNQDSIYNPPAL